MKIINFKKFIFSIIVLTLVLGALLLACNSVLSYGTPTYIKLYASSGDTLWQISKQQQDTNKYYEGKEIRYIISDIRKINNLKNSDLSVGQEILIPVL